MQMRMRIMAVRMAASGGIYVRMIGVARRDVLRQLSIYQNIYFRGLDAAAIHLREAKTRA